MLGWLRKVAAAEHDEIVLPYQIVERCRDGHYSPALSRKIAAEPTAFPREAVARARDLIMGDYGPRTLTRVAADESWSFE